MHPKLEAVHTPARKDKRLWSTAVFAVIVTVNHKLGLALTMGELMVLGTVLGAYMGQSQLGVWAKIKALS